MSPVENLATVPGQVENLASVHPEPPSGPPPACQARLSLQSSKENITAPDGQRGSVTDSAVVAVQKAVKHKFVSSGWHSHPVNVKIRTFLRGKAFGIALMVSLFVALFFPDFFVVGQVPDNTAIDTILLLVMIIFAFEFLGLTLTDASYILSFFFFMDLIGTFSMAFDISYMFGSDATEVVNVDTSEESAGKENIIVLRAARAAKLGARAGRLSRVLKLVRFLPFVNTQAGDQKNYARVLTTQLTNVLSTRVACLTIILVIIVPIFGLLNYPEDDYSLTSWADRISRLAEHAENSALAAAALAGAQKALENELQEFNAFYEDLEYGPCHVCFSKNGGCKAVDMNWAFERPERLSSIMQITSKNVVVEYNFASVRSFEGWLGVILIIFIISVMLFFGMVLSSSVTALAVAPLERMLSSVRDIAGKMFHLTQDIGHMGEEDSEGDDDLDEEQASEMQLLELVVKKLAATVELNSAKASDLVHEDMKEEDQGIVRMMQVEQQAPTGPSRHVQRKVTASTTNVGEFGIEPAIFHSWQFNPVTMAKGQQAALCAWMVYNNSGCRHFCVNSVDEKKLLKFVEAAERSYLKNPYHNWIHGVDVTHTVFRQLKLAFMDAFLSEIGQFAMLISAICHDLGHPAVNNPFLIETSHELALRYNDKSPLENMHCAKLFELGKDEPTCIFNGMGKDQYKEFRKLSIEAILHTDMVAHFTMVKDLSLLYATHQDLMDQYNPKEEPPQEVCEIFQTADNKLLVCDMLLHSADICNPCKPWDMCHMWAMNVLGEFFAQGDQEKALRIPVQMLNDRDKVNVPNSQLGFIEFVVLPLVTAQANVFPTLHEFGDNLEDNIKHWQQTVITENKPNEEDKEKLQNRVQKMAEKIRDSQKRLQFQSQNRGSIVIEQVGGSKRAF